MKNPIRDAKLANRKLQYYTCQEILKALIIQGHNPKITEEDLIEDPEGLLSIEPDGRIRSWDYKKSSSDKQKRYRINTTHYQRMARDAVKYLKAFNEYF